MAYALSGGSEMEWTKVLTPEEYEHNRKGMAKARGFRRLGSRLFRTTLFLGFTLIGVVGAGSIGWLSQDIVIIVLAIVTIPVLLLVMATTWAMDKYWQTRPRSQFTLLTCPNCRHQDREKHFTPIEYLACPSCGNMTPPQEYQTNSIDVKY